MSNTGRNKFKKVKWLINTLVFINSLLPKGAIKFLLGMFRHTNGRLGLLIRYVLIKNLAKSCGDNVSVHPGVYLLNLYNIEFGYNVSIHPMCYIDGYGGLSIGNNVSIAHATSVLTTNHTWADVNIPIKYNPETLGPVVIADDVWLGAGVRVLAGVNISTRAIVAAGAVVNKDVASNCIVGGIPARVLKNI